MYAPGHCAPKGCCRLSHWKLSTSTGLSGAGDLLKFFHRRRVADSGISEVLWASRADHWLQPTNSCKQILSSGHQKFDEAGRFRASVQHLRDREAGGHRD